VGQAKLALLCLLRKNVTFKGVLSFDFTGAGKLETLLGTGFCFLFGHFSYLY
jgi:hypothetical protein